MAPAGWFRISEDRWMSGQGIQGTKRIDSYVLVHSNVPPDPTVRKQVLRRAKGRCERCGISWELANFLEIHHIIAAGVKIDRYNNCVALCPNCHKEAQLASRNVAIETELLKFVRSFPAKAPPS
jgi:5-methylcytosine-specific restriction protein A